MRMRLLLLCALLAIPAGADVGTCLVTNCADVSRILRNGTNAYTRFELTVRALSDIGEFGRGMIVADESGAMLLGENGALDVKPQLRNGDRFTVSGRVCTPPDSGRFTRAETIGLLEHGAPYVPPTITPDDFAKLRGDFRPIRLTGIVRNLIFDEIDPYYAFFVLEGHHAVAYAPCRYADGDRQASRKLIGAEIAVTGVREMALRKNRRQLGPDLLSFNSRIEILRPPPADPFAVPTVDELDDLGPMEVARSGPHRARGTVLAGWQAKHFLLQRQNGDLIRVELEESPAPSPSSSVEVVGFPAADPYHINLVHARWRTAAGSVPAKTSPLDIRSADIFRPTPAGRVVVPAYHGKVLRVTGTLVDRTGAGQLALQDGTGLVTVDISAGNDGDWPIGSTIRATGVCIMDIAVWQPHETFPQIRGFILVTRGPDDLRLVALPPWWTPARIWTVVGILACLVIGILIWNASLRILAERRGRALLRGQIESVKSKLQVEERTRLAVELHDSLSQTLTGVSMEIAAADDLKHDETSEMSTHLARASQTLKSCRDELRNCLWDLRSEALDEPDMTRAILRTLQPHIDGPQLSVRFNVPRARISDNTAHALLRMIRELVVNALRHGHATAVKVAGSLDADALNFSVRDNGCGFDPDDHPGVLQGHFGLQGIHERIEHLGGTLTVESHPGGGTRISGRIPAPTPTGVGVGTSGEA